MESPIGLVALSARHTKPGVLLCRRLPEPPEPVRPRHVCSALGSAGTGPKDLSAKLMPTIDSVVAMPAVGDTIKPLSDELRRKLNGMVTA